LIQKQAKASVPAVAFPPNLMMINQNKK